MMLHVNLMQGISVRMHWSLMYVIHVCMYPHIKKFKKKGGGGREGGRKEERGRGRERKRVRERERVQAKAIPRRDLKE